MAKIKNKTNSSAIWIDEAKQCVVFKNGVGETTDKKAINWFKNHGYTVIDDTVSTVKPLSADSTYTITK